MIYLNGLTPSFDSDTVAANILRDQKLQITRQFKFKSRIYYNLLHRVKRLYVLPCIKSRPLQMGEAVKQIDFNWGVTS